jgi:hypothetical protein
MARTARLVAGWLILYALTALAEAKPPRPMCEEGSTAMCVENTPTPAPTVTATAAPTATAPIPTPPPSDTIAPTAKILSPVGGAVVPAGSLQVTVEATDNVGVTGVRFMHNGVVVGTKNVAPWIFTYQNVQPPASTIGVFAYDEAGNTTYAENNITVVENFTPTPTTAPQATATPAPTVAPTAAPTPPSGDNMPIPPQATVDTTLPVSTGVVRAVPAGGNLQAALDAAQPGDVVELAAGATWTGKFIAKPKTGSAKIWVRSSRYAELPPKGGIGVRPSDAPKMAKLVSPNQDYALVIELMASNYHFTGLEVAAANTSSTSAMYGLISLGYTAAGQWATSLSQLSHNIVFDRMLVHGTPSGNCRRGVMLNSYSTAVIDSYFYDLHEQGADSQAIAGWNGPGPFLIENNYLEGAGENVMFGGSDAAIQNLTPSDITIRRNHFRKPSSWQSAPWVVKNHLELKHAQRVTIDSNVFDTMWPAGQQHYIVFTVRNQGGGNPWAVVQDVSFTNNKLINPIAAAGGNGPRGINFLAHDTTFPSGSQHSRRMLVSNNLFAIYPGDSFQVLGGEIDLVIQHNTADVGGIMTLSGSPKNERFIYRDNLTGTGTYGVYGDGVGCCQNGLNAYIQPGGVYTSNEMWGPWPTSGGATVSMYSGSYPGNFYPANEAAVVGADYRQTSAVHTGTDGQKIGANIDALEAATAGVVR